MRHGSVRIQNADWEADAVGGRTSVPEVTAESFGITTSVDDEIWIDRPALA